ncbi:hypothetical protein SAMN05444266_10180 [Chitinophaga jiangningensis]|uniref:Uncharacterized protein n=1 Tax=Chitinophaga jiangningensis TaxID=1419482 RepID=A0A1M6V6J0_9BACT|nr:hypothetical protein SAMN05444266_10180 [Chitinophaga jiangningensis]
MCFAKNTVKPNTSLMFNNTHTVFPHLLKTISSLLTNRSYICNPGRMDFERMNWK